MEIAEIKSRLSLQAVLDHYQLKPDRNNRLCCPWHNDKTPSLQVYPKTNTWTCFSSNCNAGSGDVIDFVMRMERLSHSGGSCTKHEAILKCKELIGNTTPPKPLSPKPLASIPDPNANTISSSSSEHYGRQAILSKFYNSRQRNKTKSKDGRAYAQSRGLDYDSEHFAYTGKIKDMRWTGGLRESIESLGIRRFNRCLLFAMRNQEGQIVNLYGRSILSNSLASSAGASSRHFYLKGKLQGLYPCWPTADMRILILTESHIDAATVLEYVQKLESQQMGQGCQCLALYGTNGFTDDHLSAISSATELEEVILFFDGDQAGRSAIKKIGKKIRLISEKIKISFVQTPEEEDINSLIVKQERAEERTILLNQLLEDRRALSFSNEGLSIEKEMEYDKVLPSNSTPGSPIDKGSLITDNIEMLLYSYAKIQITILGGIKITGLDRLRVTLKVERQESTTHLPVRHSLDLYHAKQVESLVTKIADQLDMSSGHVELILNHLTNALEEYRAKRLDLLKPKEKKGYELSVAERVAGLNYLKAEDLLKRTALDLGRTGIVGEAKNAMIAFLSYTSRKREKPLHIMYLGSSGTGKTYLQEKIGCLIPEEEKLEITSLSDNAFYYFGREELKHKLILIEDLDGAQNAEYPLREIQTKRRISKTVTIKTNKGELKTINVVVEGPVCVSGCTTREKLYEDNANRCILLYIDESTEQDKRIMNYQRQTSAGTIKKSEQEKAVQLLQNVQRLLRLVHVVNPYAELIDLPLEVFKPRRTQLLLLSFIETITFYHQYQRSVKTDERGLRYIESTAEDIESGFELLKEVLFTKSDELTKAGRRFLERLKKEVGPGHSFYSSNIRKRFRLSSSSVHRYIRELRTNGYIKYKNGNQQRGYEYQITDYEEYQKLQKSIEEKLQEILNKIKEKRSKENLQ